MESKFKIGDKVRVINYGHPILTNKETYYKMQEYFHNEPTFIELLMGWKHKNTPYVKTPAGNIIKEDETTMWLDMSTDLVGQEGIVEGSYKDLYPKMSNKASDLHIYSLKGIESKSAWYNEDQLELVNNEY